MIYQKEQGGKIVDTKDFTQSSAGDTAGITNWDDLSNSDIYIIINKSKHIGGEKGKNYYFNTYFYSGFYNNNNDKKIADDTIDINLDFEYWVVLHVNLRLTQAKLWKWIDVDGQASKHF